MRFGLDFGNKFQHFRIIKMSKNTLFTIMNCDEEPIFYLLTDLSDFELKQIIGDGKDPFGNPL